MIRLAKVEPKFAKVVPKLASFEPQFANIDTTLANIEARFTNIDLLIVKAEAKSKQKPNTSPGAKREIKQQRLDHDPFTINSPGSFANFTGKIRFSPKNLV